MAPLTSALSLRAAVRWTTSVIAPLALTASLLAAGAGSPATRTLEQLRPAAVTVAAPTTFKIATFNVLGHSHTAPGGDKYGQFEASGPRMGYAVQVIRNRDVSMVGLQEFEPVQYDKFHALTGAAWGVWPGREIPGETTDSVAWRTADWTAIQRRTYKAPYFGGTMRQRPLVLLRHNRTGQLVWLMNTHTAANTKWFPDSSQERDDAERIQAALVNKLHAADPDIPVLFTGDMNDREKFYCPVTYLSDLESASGGVHGEPEDGDPYLCQPASPVQIDWVMGTSNVRWSGYTIDDGTLVDKASDHPFIFATASIAPQPARAAGVKRVLVVDIQGLPSYTVGKGRAPFLSTLMGRGASTLQARPDDDNRRALPNTISLLTSRRVPTSRGGHGVTTNGYSGPSVHAAAGQYVSSIYDMAHNLGLRTAFYSGDPRSKLVGKTWDTSLAGTDKYGVDNGRTKIDQRLVASTDTDVARAARVSLQQRPAAITVVQLGNALRAGVAHGWRSPEYLTAVARADARLRNFVRDVNANPATHGSTLVLVTSTAPGAPATYGYGVPLVAWGPSVPAGSNLYTLNPQYKRPAGGARLPTTGTPINLGTVANLAASALTLPAIPRSTLNAHLHLDVFGP